MFTGLIENIGRIASIDPFCVETVRAPSLHIGDSIAVNGVCVTVAKKTKTSFTVDLLDETLKKTNLGGLAIGDAVNLERALTPQSRMGGHWVTGHVDETGVISSLRKTGELTIWGSDKFMHLLIPKGSIAIDGVSLTIVEIFDKSFTCHLIPHTLENTNLKHKKKGDRVNLEYDLVGKYLHRFYSLSKH